MQYHAEPNRCEPESWKTTSYTIRRPGHTALITGVKSLKRARSEMVAANKVAPGHRVFAEQEYIGEIAVVPPTRTIDVTV